MPSIYYIPAFHKVIDNLPKADEYLIFVDLQNLAVGKYDTDNERVINDDLYQITKEEIKYLLEYLYTIHSKVPNSKVYFFYDDNRNLFNEKIIPTWKSDRKKQLSRLGYSQKTVLNFSSNISRAVSDVLYYISKYSSFLNVIRLQYIDSDFTPGLSIVSKKLKNENTVFLIVSSDFDFLHLSHEKNVYIYDSKNRKRFKALQENNLYLPDNEQFTLHKIGHRFQLENEDDQRIMYNNYQIFHALIGDSSDNIPPLIKKTGVKTILKKTRDLLSEGNIRDKLILDKDYGLEFILRLTNNNVEQTYMELLNRLMITDFILLSTLIFEYNKLIEPKYLPHYNHLDYSIVKHFKDVINSVKESLTKTSTNITNVEQVKKYFSVERKIEEIFILN